MELHKFHVTDFSSRAKGHGYAVASGYSRIRSVAVHLSQTAGGEENGTGFDFVEFPGVVEHAHSDDSSLAQHELGGEFELAKHDGLQRLGLKEESAPDLATSRVAMSV